MNLAVPLPADLVERIAERAAELVLERLDASATNGGASEFLTIAEAAEVLRAKPQRVYDLCSEGRLTRHKDGSRVLIRRAEIVAYLAGEATGRVAHVLPPRRQSRATSGVAQ